jgi:regulator of RNase E activity RraB
VIPNNFISIHQNEFIFCFHVISQVLYNQQIVSNSAEKLFRE